MLGEFHLLNNASGLHNPEFFPLRTVCTALAIRHMVPSDLVFLSGEQVAIGRSSGMSSNQESSVRRSATEGCLSRTNGTAPTDRAAPHA